MQGLEFAVKNGLLVINDLEHKGSLHISFKPIGTPLISPAYEAWNDLETLINSGALNLRLYGFSTIREQRGFELKGDILLSSSHLYDPVIDNSRLHLVSLKPRSNIQDSKLKFIGLSQFGMVSFRECILDVLPKRVSTYYSSYFRNQLI